jgi:hypothetical protein
MGTIDPILHVRKPRHLEVKELTQGCIATKQVYQALNLDAWLWS